MTAIEQGIIDVFLNQNDFHEVFKSRKRYCIEGSASSEGMNSTINVPFTEQEALDALKNLTQLGFLTTKSSDSFCLIKLP